MTEHVLERGRVHYKCDNSIEPAIEVDRGDVVHFETEEVTDGPATPGSPSFPASAPGGRSRAGDGTGARAAAKSSWTASSGRWPSAFASALGREAATSPCGNRSSPRPARPSRRSTPRATSPPPRWDPT